MAALLLERPASTARPERLWSHLENRPLRGRLAGLDEHRPYSAPSSGAEERGAWEDPATFRGGRDPEKDAGIWRRASRRAVVSLLRGSRPASVAGLLRSAAASARGPEAWRVWNDLSAVLGEGDFRARLEAYEAISKAQSLAGPQPAVLFNKALLLESLGAPLRAAATWQEYLVLDSDSQWAREAQGRLTPGDEQGDHSTAHRERVERELLPRWTRALAAGDRGETEAAEHEIGSLLAQIGEQGRLLAASVSAVRDALSEQDTARLALLASGHRSFAEGVALYRSERQGEARERFEQAIRDLEKAGSPFALRARLRRLRALGKPAETDIRALLLEVEQRGFDLQAAEAWRLLGHRTMLDGRLAVGLDQYAEAERRFAALGAVEEAAVVQAMRAESLAVLGRMDEAWTALAPALSATPTMDDPWNRYSVYWVAANAVQARAGTAATELRREAAETCKALPERPLCLADTRIAVTRGLTSKVEASAELGQARHELAVAPESDGKRRTGIDLLVAEARWLLAHSSRDEATELEAVVELSERSVAGYQDLNFPLSAAKARLIRADALERLGCFDPAHLDLEAALAHVRQWDQQGRWGATAAEAPSPGLLREVLERLIALEVARSGGAPSREAFLLSEEMRDRVAPRLTPGYEPPTQADLDHVVSSVPEDTVIVEYAVLPDRGSRHPFQVVAWIVSDKGLDQVMLAPRAELAPRIAALHRAAASHDLPAWQAQARDLGREILEPVLSRLPAGTRRLALVPDSDLHALPFRGLLVPATGRYLDEDLAVSLLPSALALVKDRRPPTIRRGDRRSVLSLGFADFGALGLKRLRSAPAEAEAVARIYGAGQGDGCAGSVWRSLRLCMPEAQILHLATHAQTSLRSEGWSWLALESETIDLAKLWDELPLLPQTELVVLSACESVAGSGSGEGLGGLARPFLAKGARAVVGTLWQIEDDAAATLFPAFHRAYRASGDPAWSLQQARAALAGWREQPWQWAGVEGIETGLLRREE